MRGQIEELAFTVLPVIFGSLAIIARMSLRPRALRPPLSKRLRLSVFQGYRLCVVPDCNLMRLGTPLYLHIVQSLTGYSLEVDSPAAASAVSTLRPCLR